MKTVSQIINNSSYLAKLAAPEWKKFSAETRRLRDVCESCGTKENLQVHHLFYDASRELWEYSNEDVCVLCDTCHKEMHAQLQKFRRFVFRYLNPRTFQILNGALAVGLTHYKPLIFVHALAEFTGNENLVNNHAKAFGYKDAKGNFK